MKTNSLLCLGSFSWPLVRAGMVVVLAAGALAPNATLAQGIDRNWTGAVNANWSEPNNWSPAGTPQNGDSLHFGLVSDSNRSMVNDLPNSLPIRSRDHISFIDSPRPENRTLTIGSTERTQR